MNKTCRILSVGALVTVGVLAWWLARPTDGAAKDEEAGKKGILAYRGTVAAKNADGRHETSVRDERATLRRRELGDQGWSDNPFDEKPTFDFDDEKDAEMSEELRKLLTDLSVACGAFEPNRKAVYAAVHKLLAAIYAGDSALIPRFVKQKAIDALKWIGADGIPEMVGMLTDSDEGIVREATSALLEQMNDFDATQELQLSIIKQLVKAELTPENYESLIFTISSFKNSNKVAAALAIFDTGTDGALEALRNNLDFVFDEAEAESIATREDIVRYGDEHPDEPMEFDLDKSVK